MQAGKRAKLMASALGLAAVVWATVAQAQEAWVQIEALPTLDQAEGRLRDLSASFPDLAGFALTGGWYGVALGPYATPEAAQEALLNLRRARQIPGDSYVADPNTFRSQFWPVGANLTAPAPQVAPTPEAPPEPVAEAPEAPAPQTAEVAPQPEPVVEPVAEPELPPEPVETLAESRRLEAALSREERMDIQRALQWVGLYNSGIDGAFGRGTRSSISVWQETQGFEPTGVLASAQQAHLLETVAAERAALGITPVDEVKASIAIDLPLGLVEFDHYDPPFVHFRAKNGSGVQVILISEPGDQNTLFGLYDAMQTLEIVPQNGPRERSKSGFSLVGEDARIHSVTEVKLSKGMVKGFTLVYPADEGARMLRVLDAMKASFRAVGDSALDPTLGQPMGVGRADLIGGLDVRHPEFARSGFFINENGAVLTAGEGLGTCGKVTIEGLPATIAFSDAGLGVAVLTPEDKLAPSAVAAFETETVNRGAAIVVAGFSYPEALSAPVLNFGTLSDLTGLAGEAERARLAVPTLAGDVGGPVLDSMGAVLGLVLPRGDAATQLLPSEMTVAVQTAALVPVLAENGFAPVAADAQTHLAAEDLAALAGGFTVQIECWK
ncbi:putative peptidoglycan binding protein [Rhodobacter aestuarii]|uniref:Putative peptidoglycan binding domain-containing protein n=1 Tax=Rhodobacter aestuarii TaxID=453582 RepID=A0A1N7L3N2_9RHOB|nr:trypsin-like peptidase domain-containing protein [Rhodobacter aestuarii]PTV95398.1 putative peptidoglycan binding protein [Rhodobacter aestuarii]SIS68469.1 Putative peptidoglycan binding domain-containing protein [Rhodobacter aestuarii]